MPSPDSLPTPSLIDRLSKEDLPGDGLDLDLAQASGKTGEMKVRRKASTAQRREAINRYKDSVKRDLEWLLNTRQVVDDRQPAPDLIIAEHAAGITGQGDCHLHQLAGPGTEPLVPGDALQHRRVKLTVQLQPGPARIGLPERIAPGPQAH